MLIVFRHFNLQCFNGADLLGLLEQVPVRSHDKLARSQLLLSYLTVHILRFV